MNAFALLAALGDTTSSFQDLVESNRRYDRAMEGSHDGIFEWDRSGELYFSRNFMALAGLPVDQPATWDALLELLTPKDKERVEDELRQADFDLEFRVAGEEPRWLRLRGKALEGGFVAGTRSDIDARKRLEAERERLLEARDRALRETRIDLARAETMTSLGNLAAGVAHDFNNYLQVIKLSAASIEVEPNGDDAESLAAIVEASDEASQLAHQLLALRRGYSGEDITRVETSKLLKDSEMLIRRLLPANIELRIEHEDLPDVLADSGQMRQVLLNLCMNARDAMQDGGLLRLRARRAERTSVDGEVHGVEISVEDEGCGMTREERAQATAPFFTTKKVGKGTGLGLTMVQSIVRRHHGTLDIESAPGAGTIIRIWLPLASADVSLREPRRHHRRSGAGLRILFIDDEPVIRRTAHWVLERVGHRVQSAGSVQEARDLIEEGSFDLILCDVMLPDGHGPDLIASAFEEREQPLVLFVSGYSAERVPLGPRTAFLRKPFDQGELMDAIDQLLDQADESDSLHP